MGTLIGKVKNNPLEEAVNQMSGLKYFFEAPMAGIHQEDPIFRFKPLPLANVHYQFAEPLKKYVQIEELYEKYGSDNKYLNITYLQPFKNDSNVIINPYLFIYFDYLKNNLGISKIVFNINRDITPYVDILLYPGYINYKKPVISLHDFHLHINNTGNRPDLESFIVLNNVNDVKNVKITSNKPHRSCLDGLRWRFAFSMDNDKLVYRDLYLNSEFIMTHKNNYWNHTNTIPGGIPLFIDCDMENRFKFTDLSSTGFLYNFFKRLIAIDKVNYPCMLPDFLPVDMVMNINNHHKYFLYMTQSSTKRFISVEDEINKLNEMSGGSIEWDMFLGDRHFQSEMYSYLLFFGVAKNQLKRW